MSSTKRYESDYAGYVYEKPNTYWTAEERVKSRLTYVDFSKPDEIKSGGVPIISDGKSAYIDDSDSHTAIVAVSGMKKSICVYMPLIYTLGLAGENMAITDPKGELYARTSGYLKKQGYNVVCLDFRLLDKDALNVLEYPAKMYRESDRDRGLSMLSDIVNALAENQRRHCKDPFWPDTGAQWCVATASMMFDAYPKLSQVNVLNWSEYNNRYATDMVSKINRMIPDGNTAKSAMNETLTSAENTLRSILITASSFLVMFKQNNKLAQMLSHSTFSIDELCRPKTALYIITDDTTSTADPVVGLIVSQIQTFLVDNAFRNGGTLDTRFNFLLDEFASFSIPNMDKALATHRSRKIRYYLCVQSIAGLRERYPNPEALLSNCGNTLYLGSTESELLAKLSEQCGTTFITPTGSERPLISQADLMTLKKSWESKEALFLNLSENIKYCATLPSIEAYDLGDEPAPVYHTAHPPIDIYTVETFMNDIIDGRTHVPFEAPIDPEKPSDNGSEQKAKQDAESSAEKKKKDSSVGEPAKLPEGLESFFNNLFDDDDND